MGEGAIAVDRPLSAAASLQRLASLEAESAGLVALDVPPPPGVPAIALAERGPDEVQAFMSLKDAIAMIVESSDPAPPAMTEQPQVSPEDADEALRYYIRGRDLALQNDFHGAVGELRQARQLDPQNIQIVRELSRNLFAVGRGTDAIEACQEIARLDPDDSEAVFTLALADATRGDYQKALVRLARRVLNSRSFDHDPLADVIALQLIWQTLNGEGYDLAAIEAGQGVLQGIETAVQPTRYRQRALAIYQSRGLIRLAIGDAYCRLGRYGEARQAYADAALTPIADPADLGSRLVYADLRLGRTIDAQVELLAALRAEQGPARRRTLLLCRYLAEHVPDRQAMAEACEELIQSRPDDPGLVRAAAAVIPDAGAERVLQRYIDGHRRDVAIAGDLIRRVARRDLNRAVDLVIDLVSAQPDLAARYVQHLLVAAPTGASGTLAAVHGRPSSPARAIIEIRLLIEAGAMGEAWAVCHGARETWPDNADLRIQQMELAGLLEEPSLIDELAPELRDIDGPLPWLALSRARRATGQLDHAVSAAIVAGEEEPEDLAVLVEMATAYFAQAVAEESVITRRDLATRAQLYATRATAAVPMDDQAHQILLSLYGRGGPLEDAEHYKQAGANLNEVNPDSHLFGRIVAREELGRGQTGQAIHRVLNLYQEDPTDSAAIILAVAGWLQSDQAETALAWLDEQLASRPGHPALLEQWTSVAMQLDRSMEVVDRLLSAWATEPPDYAAGRLLESVYRMTGRNDEAISLGRVRLAGRPETIRRELEFAALHGGAGELDEAYSRLDWILQQADRASVEELISAIDIVERLEANDLRRDAMTLELTERVIERDPGVTFGVYAARLRAMAVSGWESQELSKTLIKALRDSEGAAGTTPQEVMIYRDLAQKLVDSGHACQAGHILRTRLLANAELETAARSFLMTIAIVSDAVCGGQGDASVDLLHELNVANKLPPFPWNEEPLGLAEALYEASQVHTLVGDKPGAETILLELLALEPDHYMAMNNIGYARIEAGISDPQTVQWIEQAHQALPDDISVIDTIAWLRYKQGRFADTAEYAGALSLIMKALKAETEPTAELRDHLGDIAYRMGRPDSAVQAWRQGVEILQAPEHRSDNVQNYMFLQTRMWGIVVADPRQMYHRNYGVLLEQLRRKIEAVEAGQEPPVAALLDDGNIAAQPEETDGPADRQGER